MTATRDGHGRVYVVRHAKAGSRSRWTGDDMDRPLSKRGRAQAEGLVAMLDHSPLGGIASSGYLRCRETVEPLGAERELAVVTDRRLAEGAGGRGAMALVGELAEGGGVLCTHGDVIWELLAELHRRGVELDHDPIAEKGSAWELTIDGETVRRASYRPPQV